VVTGPEKGAELAARIAEATAEIATGLAEVARGQQRIARATAFLERAATGKRARKQPERRFKLRAEQFTEVELEEFRERMARRGLNVT
jgi:hypothetical protein